MGLDDKGKTPEKDKDEDFLRTPIVIKERWRVVSRLGGGAFGQVYIGCDLAKKVDVAVKVEPSINNDKQVLRMEVAVLKKLQGMSQSVCRYYGSGSVDGCNFIVMELLGENLADIRRNQPSQCFSIHTAVLVGMQMLDAIECIHEAGYLHRDIKPSNFAVGRDGPKRSRVYLLDFGLARRHLCDNGKVRSCRVTAGFRGTARYASISAHKSHDLGRKDDLWSLFYVMVELATGKLPWRRIKEKEKIGEMKERTELGTLTSNLPLQFLAFGDYLSQLSYSDKPNYEIVRSLFKRMLTAAGLTTLSPMDWVLPAVAAIPTTAPSADDVNNNNNNNNNNAAPGATAVHAPAAGRAGSNAAASGVSKAVAPPAASTTVAAHGNSNDAQAKTGGHQPLQRQESGKAAHAPASRKRDVRSPTVSPHGAPEASKTANNSGAHSHAHATAHAQVHPHAQATASSIHKRAGRTVSYDTGDMYNREQRSLFLDRQRSLQLKVDTALQAQEAQQLLADEAQARLQGIARVQMQAPPISPREYVASTQHQQQQQQQQQLQQQQPLSPRGAVPPHASAYDDDAQRPDSPLNSKQSDRKDSNGGTPAKKKRERSGSIFSDAAAMIRNFVGGSKGKKDDGEGGEKKKGSESNPTSRRPSATDVTKVMNPTNAADDVGQDALKADEAMVAPLSKTAPLPAADKQATAGASGAANVGAGERAGERVGEDASTYAVREVTMKHQASLGESGTAASFQLGSSLNNSDIRGQSLHYSHGNSGSARTSLHRMSSGSGANNNGGGPAGSSLANSFNGSNAAAGKLSGSPLTPPPVADDVVGPLAAVTGSGGMEGVALLSQVENGAVDVHAASSSSATPPQHSSPEQNGSDKRQAPSGLQSDSAGVIGDRGSSPDVGGNVLRRAASLSAVNPRPPPVPPPNRRAKGRYRLYHKNSTWFDGQSTEVASEGAPIHSLRRDTIAEV